MGAELLMQAQRLHKHYPVRESMARRLVSRGTRWLRAVDGVEFGISAGELVGLVGESGCGKSTTGRLLARLETPTSGRILYSGEDLTHVTGQKLKPFRRHIQVIFQDPYRSLDPRYTVGATVAEPLVRHRVAPAAERTELVAQMLDRAGLQPGRAYLDRYPHELSGGQRQRVAIARAMVLEPDFVVADEPVSMLDVSVRAGILNLMLRLKEEFGTSYLFVTHDLSVARYVSDRIMVMYLGRIVEQGPADEVIQHPAHPYTQLLISAVPGMGRKQRIRVSGDAPNAAAIPSGCRFHDRCPLAIARCRSEDPVLREITPGRAVACHVVADRSPDVSEPPVELPESSSMQELAQ